MGMALGFKPAPFVSHFGTWWPARTCPSKAREQKFQEEDLKTQATLKS